MHDKEERQRIERCKKCPLCELQYIDNSRRMYLCVALKGYPCELIYKCNLTVIKNDVEDANMDNGFYTKTEDVEKAEREADEVMNDKLEKESIDTNTTIDNSYEVWKNSLKIVNVPKFDLSYFQSGAAYCVRKHAMDDDEFNGIMISADENTLRVLKRGTHINYENDTEIVEIPLKEYVNGRWYIVRLVKEEK